MKKSSIIFVIALLLLSGCVWQNEDDPQNEKIEKVIESFQFTDVDTDEDEAGSQNATADKNGSSQNVDVYEVGIYEVNVYKGEWFEIEYPKNFTVQSTTKNEVYFLSPDKSVEFFVFSPLWAGDPATYLTISGTEELVDEKIEESGSGIDKKRIKWATIKAKDGSYYRSFVSIKDQYESGSDLHHVFGIKYTDQIAYKKYLPAYEAFKKSLRQYAD